MHAAALYPGLFEAGCEMAREGVTRSIAKEIAIEACAVAGKAMASDREALADGTLARRVKREVRALVLGDHRPRRRRGARDESPGSCCRLPVFGWISNPSVPLASWDMHHTFIETVVAMPKLRRDTLIRVREDGFSFAAVAEERGPSVEGVARNLAEALADLRAALRDGRPRAEGSEWAPDPDLVLAGRWLASELSPEEESAMEERFLGDDAFYAKTAPVMQIWTLPTGMFAVDDVEEHDLARSERDLSLVTDYLGNELSERDHLEVERLLETDVVFYVKMKPLIEIWRAPIDWRAAYEHYRAETPEPEARTGAMLVEEEADADLGDPDLLVVGAWLNNRLPEHHEKTVTLRLKEDNALFDKVEPAMRVWRTRKRLLRRLGKGIGEEPVDAEDADVALVTAYLAMKLPRGECGKLEARLERDEAFARKVAPVVKAWRMPRRVGEQLEVA
jgi:hypothetical protein